MTTRTYRASAFLDAAKKQGIDVAVGSEERHVLSALNPGGHLTVNFLDLEQSTSDIVEFVEQYPVEAIIATDDDGVVLAAMASDACNLRHNSVGSVASARNKYETRRILAQAGLLTPKFWRFPADTDLEICSQQVIYPCVVKPLALSASRGVMRANNPGEFVQAFQRLLPILEENGIDVLSNDAKQVLVEGYIPGEEVVLEGIIVDDQLLPLAIFDKPDPLDGPFFQETIYVTPSRHTQDTQHAIIETGERALTALGLHNGPVHIELRINEAGIWVVEVAPRSIGGYCSKALRFDGDVTLEELILQEALGQPINNHQHATPASGVMMVPIPHAGILCGIEGIEEARKVPGIEEIKIAISSGQTVMPPPEGSQYLGFIFARGETAEQVETALRGSHNCLNIIIES